MFNIFFKSNGVVHVSYLDKGKTIGQYLYLNDCLKPMVTTLNKKRQTKGSKITKCCNKFHNLYRKPKIYNNRPSSVLARSRFLLSLVFRLHKTTSRLSSKPASMGSQIVELVETIPHQECINTLNK